MSGREKRGKLIGLRKRERNKEKEIGTGRKIENNDRRFEK